MKGIRLNNGHPQVLAALQSEDGQAISYLFKRDGKGWRVFAAVKHRPVPVVTSLKLGAVGVDLNVDHLSVSETGPPGDWVRSLNISLATYGKSEKQAAALVGDAVVQVVGLAWIVGKPRMIERLDFSKQTDQLEGEYPGLSRMLLSFTYGKIKTYFLSRGYRKEVEAREVNPARFREGDGFGNQGPVDFGPQPARRLPLSQKTPEIASRGGREPVMILWLKMSDNCPLSAIYRIFPQTGWQKRKIAEMAGDTMPTNIPYEILDRELAFEPCPQPATTLNRVGTHLIERTVLVIAWVPRQTRRPIRVLP